MGKLLAIYVFGSVARDQGDAQSDLDLLAIVADGCGKVDEKDVLAHIPAEMRQFEPSVSWYGHARIGQMFRNGELFAWHLHYEAVPIFDPQLVLPTLGPPAPYVTAVDDVAFFETLLASIAPQLETQPGNAVYELGLVYVCLRNIGMAASGALASKPNFSRYSPYELPGVDPPPLTRSAYETAMACRMAGQRGIVPPAHVCPIETASLCRLLQPWAAAVRNNLETDDGSVESAYSVSGTR
jgi:hypothetical protein